MTQQIVGIADMKIAQSGLLTSYGFGSCVGVVMYDPRSGLAGLLHVMLPDSTAFENVENPLKFADTGIIRLRTRLLASGANPERLVCKLAGGASVYQNKTTMKMFDIGDQNAKKVKAVLREMRIPVIAEDLGGRCSRTIDFDVENQICSIKRITNQGTEKIVL